MLGLAGGSAAVAAAAVDPAGAAAAAGQTWPAFVLVGGLLLVGLVASADGLFEWAGSRLAGALPGGSQLFCGAALVVALVSAVLNLDTAVAFLTPVLVHTARRRGEDNRVLLATCILMANAGSLLLPGSNLTNLIVQDGHAVAGWDFLARMAVPWLAAVLVTAGVIAWSGRAHLGGRVVLGRPPAPRTGAGAAAVAGAVVLMLALRAPAVEVAALGAVGAAWCLWRGRLRAGQVWDTLGLPALVGLFGLAVGLGTVGRKWSAPARLLHHLDPWATAGFGAVASVLVNNLPAAALLSARRPPHPFSLLIGLDLGPNLLVSGSLSWMLWMASARQAGARPDLGRTVRTGVVAAPLSIAVAVAALLLVAGRS